MPVNQLERSLRIGAPVINSTDQRLFFSDGGLLADDAGLTYNKTTDTLTVAGGVVSGNLTAGSVLFAGTAGLISQDNANFFFDDTNNFLGLGTNAPAARLMLNGNISAAAWTTNGIQARFDAATYTDTSSSGAVADVGVIAIGTPTLAANSATTYAIASTLRINNSPQAGSNVTITAGYAVHVDNGDVRFDGGIAAGGFGTGSSAPKYNWGIGHSMAAVGWGANGAVFRLNAGTVTDTTTADGATVSNAHIHSILRPTLAATNASSGITYTTSATWYIINAPLAGSNVTITNPLALQAAAGNVVFNGSLGVGASVTNPTELLQLNGNVSTTAWTTNGVRLRAVGRTYTDTSSSGTVATIVVDAFQRPTIAASNAVTYTTAATVVITNSPIAGSNVTITNPLSLLIDDGNTRMDGKLIVNSNSNAPTAAFTVLNAGVSAAAWGTSGIWGRFTTGTATDTSTADGATVTNTVFYSFGTATLAASNAVTNITYTQAANIYVQGAVSTSGLVTITNSYSVWIDNGDVRFDGALGIGSSMSALPTAILQVNGAKTQAAWGVNGIRTRFGANTFTDSSSSGTVATAVADGFGTPTFAASSATVFSDAATVYITNAPGAGSNVTITRAWAFWVDNGNVRFDGGVSIGSLTGLLSGSDVDITQTTGGVLTIGRNDTGIAANDSLGKIRFYSNDTSTTSNNYAAEIEVIAENTITTDINPGTMIFKTTPSSVAGALTERLRIDSAGVFTFADGANMAFNTTTGTKIGTATTQKIGFWNATPVVQNTGWSVSNEASDKSYDADATTVDELADVLGTLIETLKTYGILGA